MSRRSRSHLTIGTLLAAALIAALPAAARSLQSVRTRGTLTLCAHPNALPFASRKDNPPGFQVELARAIAQQLGVSLTPVWIIGGSQIRRSECDIVMDAIADREAQDETGLQLSAPYYRTGVVLALRPSSHVASLGDLSRATRVGVTGGSMASMLFDQRGVPISTFGFEDEMLQALADGEIEAAAVSHAAAGYYNVTHADRPVRLLNLDEAWPQLSWNVSVGLLHPDAELRHAIDDTVSQLTADGTIARIYAHYGMPLQAPR